ncbi:hypothetical protein NDU88_000410 [Pleurodeles waltl]|uniref:Uncharacterized protein n=1 Tax=Pleurodeles waltl TaxID=8319 RepID=A0AAV7WFF7_PLEWA|nr:hypothetical protein NDU88_000410 [Pleurodeles waltl]
MLWECAEAMALWPAVSSAREMVTGRAEVCTKEGSLLGLFRRSTAAEATSRFIDLALLIARRLIAMHWKASTLPGIAHGAQRHLNEGVQRQRH